MRSFCAVALLALVVTECLGAQSDRSRQRSSPIRSVPVAADIKRDVDFDCPEEFGYYPHPSDCTLYYVCVFGGALLESCTGGLMYSHELQTCDWPRNVGCDGTSVLVAEDVERISEREPPPPPPPRRTPPPPPPPRAQPNPIVTSRGQPKFNRDEYEKQQQLYAEVDDLPPVEEIENDRQQRVNRGQPPTIGQVQKDRDGYLPQGVSSGRTLNSNIIPASIPQSSGKIGSFSFGTQVDDRRATVVTQAPQAYSEDKRVNVTDFLHDRQLDIETNEINVDDTKKQLVVRKKRDLSETEIGTQEKNLTSVDKLLSKRSDHDEEAEFSLHSDDDTEDSERGKRQIRYYVKNGYSKPTKNWVVAKPIKLVNIPQYSYNQQNNQGTRYSSNYNGLSSNKFYDSNRNPYVEDNSYAPSQVDTFSHYQFDAESRRPFKPSLPDPSNSKYVHNPANVATQIITKSPPISSLNNNENPFASLAGGFYNNAPKQTPLQNVSPTNRPNYSVLFSDASNLPSTIVTAKPVPIGSSPRPNDEYKSKFENGQHIQKDIKPHTKQMTRRPPVKEDDYKDRDNSSEYEDSDESSEDDSREENEKNDEFEHDFPEPPYEFTHPKYKYSEIENPFANPNFDFDEFLSKLSNGQYSPSTTQKYKNVQMAAIRATDSPTQSTTASSKTVYRTSTLNYNGMSSPKPFTVPVGQVNSANPSNILRQTDRPSQSGHWIQIPQSSQNLDIKQKDQQSQTQNIRILPPDTPGIPLEAVKSNLRQSNFKDERRLSINPNFNRFTVSTPAYEEIKLKGNHQRIVSISQNPYAVSTASPIILSTPKQQYLVKPEKIISLQPHLIATGKPYLISTVKPHNAYAAYKHSTAKPLTTIANQQLSALQNYWQNLSTESQFFVQSTPRPNAVSSNLKNSNYISQTIRPFLAPGKSPNNYSTPSKEPLTTTTIAPKRRPIPKPSPEMNDYYYDDDEQYYYEPPVKSKYMPSSEVRPKRPPMAQNYREYDDSYSYEDLEDRPIKPIHSSNAPSITYKPETSSRNPNGLSEATKTPIKEFNKIVDGKIAIPVYVDYSTPAPTILRPEISNYKILHQPTRNRTIHMRKPVVLSTSGPFTQRPPKYLNQTTLRPYTVRHRLAKPTTANVPVTIAPNNGKTRHQNIVAQTMFTTLRDNFNQETRYTKTKHDNKMNSLEPTESIAPVSYSASPRPKMLYNGSQNYSPDQYDPYYAVYDEDGELYKDTDYVQQYNTASLRPAVQQTYRGTPPSRRPVETYTPRPVASDDYDDALIQGQVNNQNQYQSGIRQSTRGEGNELGYDHNPSSVRTPIYEATPISTTPTTTSTTTTTTTTQRPTTAPFTEAMTPSRYTTRSPTDENPKPEPHSSPSPIDESDSDLPISSTLPSVINFSTLAKPFERTDNMYRLQETLSSTERLPALNFSSRVTNLSNTDNMEVVPSKRTQESKKVISLTSGFSIRRNPNNTNNPYTLTVLTRPFTEYDKSRSSFSRPSISKDYSEVNGRNVNVNNESRKKVIIARPVINKSHFATTERKDFSPEITGNGDDIPVYVKSTTKSSLVPELSEPPPTTFGETKHYIKSAIKRPFYVKRVKNLESTESILNPNIEIDAALRNVHNKELSQQSQYENNAEHVSDSKQEDAETWEKPLISPYRTLDNLRKNYDSEESNKDGHITSTSSIKPIDISHDKPRQSQGPSYYSYRVIDEDVPDQTTEVFSGKVKNVLKAFFDTFVSSSPKLNEAFPSTTVKVFTSPVEKVVNIGHQKKTPKYTKDSTSPRPNIKRLQVMTEPTITTFILSSNDANRNTDKYRVNNFSSTTTSTTSTNIPVVSPTSPTMIESSTNNAFRFENLNRNRSLKFGAFNYRPSTEKSRKFYKIVIDEPSSEVNDQVKILKNDDIVSIQPPKPTKSYAEISTNEIASTTSTTKSTVTIKLDGLTSTTKNVPFPTRTSRVNPAIKLAATNPGGGRRSYQSTTKCSSDNSLQANPKCNEIRYQRPTITRGRGSAHYSTQNGADAPQPVPNRGTPPTRSRPTLKPSTAIVSKSTEFVDIYAYPPSRSAPVYPQPTPDKTAAKCRKDVCLLPDCYCGGKEIPGDLPVETVPQIVLLTFDDSVNDLNKGLYTDLFEKGRVNPNGCPITATFYVSHEWTDYSQVQNLYAAGHEMASHTISHSFGEQFSQKKWNREVGGQREILAAYGGVKLEDVRGMRAPFLSVGGNKMFKMLYDSNFTYDSSMPVYENRPPSWPYTLDYKLFHDCMIPPCPTKSYPGVWEVPMVMWQDLNGGRCSMGDACANPPDAEGVYKMILKNFDRHYTTNRAPFGLFYHAAWFTQPHHKEGFIMFLDFINQMQDVWIVTNWQALQWVRDPTPISRLNNFQPFQCNYPDRPKKCNNPKVCNLWHKSGVRYMRTCQPCPEIYPWTGKTGIRSSRIDNDNGE
ncbi:mucin-2 [Amyelois transitella]|uniref:mucin-2 n=1 Tax=Amyelois transitella TaxID=680683 RepID=UPI00298FAB40|nr:mucin-2 [Amyelois transitella]